MAWVPPKPTSPDKIRARHVPEGSGVWVGVFEEQGTYNPTREQLVLRFKLPMIFKCKNTTSRNTPSVAITSIVGKEEREQVSKYSVPGTAV